LVGVADRGFPDGDEALVRVVGKRTVDKRVHDAEDGSVRADAEGERKDDDGDESGSFSEAARGVAKVLQEGMEPGERAHVRVTSRVKRRPLATLHRELDDDSVFYGAGVGKFPSRAPAG